MSKLTACTHNESLPRCDERDVEDFCKRSSGRDSQYDTDEAQSKAMDASLISSSCKALALSILIATGMLAMLWPISVRQCFNLLHFDG